MKWNTASAPSSLPMLTGFMPIHVIAAREKSRAKTTRYKFLFTMRLDVLLHFPLPRCPVWTIITQDRLHVLAKAFPDARSALVGREDRL